MSSLAAMCLPSMSEASNFQFALPLGKWRRLRADCAFGALRLMVAVLHRLALPSETATWSTPPKFEQ